MKNSQFITPFSIPDCLQGRSIDIGCPNNPMFKGIYISPLDKVSYNNGVDDISIDIDAGSIVYQDSHGIFSVIPAEDAIKYMPYKNNMPMNAQDTHEYFKGLTLLEVAETLSLVHSDYSTSTDFSINTIRFNERGHKVSLTSKVKMFKDLSSSYGLILEDKGLHADIPFGNVDCINDKVISSQNLTYNEQAFKSEFVHCMVRYLSSRGMAIHASSLIKSINDFEDTICKENIQVSGEGRERIATIIMATVIDKLSNEQENHHFISLSSFQEFVSNVLSKADMDENAPVIHASSSYISVAHKEYQNNQIKDREDLIQDKTEPTI